MLVDLITWVTNYFKSTFQNIYLEGTYLISTFHNKASVEVKGLGWFYSRRPSLAFAFYKTSLYGSLFPGRGHPRSQTAENVDLIVTDLVA